MDAELRAAYLRRLGLQRLFGTSEEPATIDALFRLQRAHVERIAWDTLWIHLGDHWSIDPVASARRIADRGRGGYCFHLNGAFCELLVALGYQVERHAATVHRPGVPDADAPDDHLALTVSGLPSPDNETGRWLVDVGLGSGIHEPMALVAERCEQQGRIELSLAATEVAGGATVWRLTRTPPSGWRAISWADEAVAMRAFDARHRWLSTASQSPFVQVATVQRWRDGDVDVLRGLVLHRAEGTESTICSRADLVATLADRFDIDLGATSDAVVDRLWSDLARAHEIWEAAGRP